MKILDKYIIKQFLKSFFFMFLLFIPIGILVDVSEKIDKFKEHDLGFYEVFNYYLDFIWYYGYFLFPIFVFLAVIWFTSKLSTNSEVVAILSSGVSFSRYLHPFILTSIFIAILSQAVHDAFAPHVPSLEKQAVQLMRRNAFPTQRVARTKQRS